MTVRAERYDAISHRLMRDGEIVGFALQMANDRWGMFGPDCETRLGKLDYATPKDVAKAFAPLGERPTTGGKPA